MALQGLLAIPSAGSGCLLCLALFLSIAVTNKSMEEQSGIFLYEGMGFPNHDLKCWGAASGPSPVLAFHLTLFKSH